MVKKYNNINFFSCKKFSSAIEINRFFAKKPLISQNTYIGILRIRGFFAKKPILYAKIPLFSQKTYIRETNHKKV